MAKKIEEILKVTVTFPKSKQREESTWNLERNTILRNAIEECLETGKEVFAVSLSNCLYHVKPRFPLIESAMAEPENQSLLKVTVNVYSQAFNLGVREERP